jgi:acetyl esterase
LAQSAGLAQYLDPASPLPVEERRRALERANNDLMGSLAFAPVPPEVSVREVVVECAQSAVTVRLFVPEGGRTSKPACLFYFGGAFWQRSFDAPDFVFTCWSAALQANAVVAAIDYPLAPEHPYPAALQAGVSVLGWMAAHSDELGIDRNRLAVAGLSSGANLAAATALCCRDHGGPPLALQILEVPALDLTGAHQAVIPGLEGAPFAEVITLYGVSDKLQDPYVSPLLAPSLSGLPPALILAAELDPLSGDATAYADALRAAGVTAVCAVYAGQIHQSPALSPVSASARAWRAQVNAALRSGL